MCGSCSLLRCWSRSRSSSGYYAPHDLLRMWCIQHPDRPAPASRKRTLLAERSRSSKLSSRRTVCSSGTRCEERGESILENLSDEVRAIGDSHHRNEKTSRTRPELLGNGLLEPDHQFNTFYDLKCSKPIWVDRPGADAGNPPGRPVFRSQLPNLEQPDRPRGQRVSTSRTNGEIRILHSDFLLDTAEGSRNVAVALILHRDVLSTVRTEEPPAFQPSSALWYKRAHARSPVT